MRSLPFAIAMLAAMPPRRMPRNHASVRNRHRRVGAHADAARGRRPGGGRRARRACRTRRRAIFTSWESASAGFRKGDKLEMTVKTAIERTTSRSRSRSGASRTAPSSLNAEPLRTDRLRNTSSKRASTTCRARDRRHHPWPLRPRRRRRACRARSPTTTCCPVLLGHRDAGADLFLRSCCCAGTGVSKGKGGSMDKFMIHSIATPRLRHAPRLRDRPFTYVIHERMIAGAQGEDPPWKAA